jgi:four helix bundle protein
MGFDALDLAVKLPALLRQSVQQLTRYDRDLADQVRRAINGVALAVAEGARREGRDRVQFFRTAAGSASEARTALLLAEGWGYLHGDEIADGVELLDRQLAILYRLIHPA